MDFSSSLTGGVTGLVCWKPLVGFYGLVIFVLGAGVTNKWVVCLSFLCFVTFYFLSRDNDVP